jgi:hypothetical protein
MNETSGPEVIRKFHEQLTQGNIGDDVIVLYRVAGGAPEERLEEEITIAGGGVAGIVELDMMGSGQPKEASTQLDQAETLDLLRQIEAGINDMVPESEARFLPDSLVGSVTIQVDGEETTLYFSADEDELEPQNRPRTQLRQVIRSMRGISKRLIGESS